MKVKELIKLLLEKPMDEEVVVNLGPYMKVQTIAFVGDKSDDGATHLMAQYYANRLAEFKKRCNGCDNLYYLNVCEWDVDRAVAEYKAREGETKYGRSR